MHLPHLAGAAAIVLTVLVTLVLLRRFLPDRPLGLGTLLEETWWMALLFAVNGGLALYLNPELGRLARRWAATAAGRPPYGTAPGSWLDPAVSSLDRTLFWILLALFLLVALRTVLHPRWRWQAKLINLALGVLAAYGTYLGLLELLA